MNRERTSAWSALEGTWYYLGRALTDGLEIATLVVGQAAGAPGQRDQRERVALAFTSEANSRQFLAAAPPGVELLRVDGDDLRAKEEWLRALTEQGTATLVFDPRGASLEESLDSASAIKVHTALGYILSHRRASACL